MLKIQQRQVCRSVTLLPHIMSEISNLTFWLHLVYESYRAVLRNIEECWNRQIMTAQQLECLKNWYVLWRIVARYPVQPRCVLSEFPIGSSLLWLRIVNSNWINSQMNSNQPDQLNSMVYVPLCVTRIQAFRGGQKRGPLSSLKIRCSVPHDQMHVRLLKKLLCDGNLSSCQCFGCYIFRLCYLPVMLSSGYAIFRLCYLPVMLSSGYAIFRLCHLLVI
jgi:hypothetical protein